MSGENEQHPGKARLRFIAWVLVLTLLAFGVIGALVTLLPDQVRRLRSSEEKKKVPQARQIERETLHKGAPVPGS